MRNFTVLRAEILQREHRTKRLGHEDAGHADHFEAPLTVGFSRRLRSKTKPPPPPAAATPQDASLEPRASDAHTFLLHTAPEFIPMDVDEFGLSDLDYATMHYSDELMADGDLPEEEDVFGWVQWG